MKKFILLLVLLSVIAAPTVAQDGLTLTVLGTYTHGSFAEGASEIAAYDPTTRNGLCGQR